MATTSHGRSSSARLGAVLDRWATHAANHRTCVGFGVVLAAAHLLLAAQRVYQYRHHNAWVVTARASGTFYATFTHVTFPFYRSSSSYLFLFLSLSFIIELL